MSVIVSAGSTPTQVNGRYCPTCADADAARRGDAASAADAARKQQAAQAASFARLLSDVAGYGAAGGAFAAKGDPAAGAAVNLSA